MCVIFQEVKSLRSHQMNCLLVFNQKAAMLPDFEKAEKTKDKKLPANSVSRFLSYKEQLLCCKI